MDNTIVRVGIGVILVNESNQVLIGKRKGNLAPHYSIPGGHLELGETFEQAAIREVREETGLVIKDPKVMSISNNLKTYQDEGKHYVSVSLIAHNPSGQLYNCEPHKCEGWEWYDTDILPQPHFDASEQAISCYLQQRFYLGSKG